MWATQLANYIKTTEDCIENHDKMTGESGDKDDLSEERTISQQGEEAPEWFEWLLEIMLFVISPVNLFHSPELKSQQEFFYDKSNLRNKHM